MRHANRKPMRRWACSRSSLHRTIPSAPGAAPTLPGIAGGYPAAGGAELIAVDERGVDLAQPRCWRKLQVRHRWRHTRPEQPLGGTRDIVGAGRLVKLAGGHVGGEQPAEEIAVEERQA